MNWGEVVGCEYTAVKQAILQALEQGQAAITEAMSSEAQMAADGSSGLTAMLKSRSTNGLDVERQGQ